MNKPTCSTLVDNETDDIGSYEPLSEQGEKNPLS